MLFALSLADPERLRQELATVLQSSSSAVATLSWQLGQRADTPGTAFFIGYQAAMRCLDPSIPPDCWAAFVISERGVRDPRQMQTRLDLHSGRLKGCKSHVMLAGQGLDRLYVVARTDTGLSAVTLNAGQVQVDEGAPQSFLPDLPHYPVHFDVYVQPSQIVSHDAHRQLNKPFRYWEDVQVMLALAGWLQQWIVIDEQAVKGLIAAYEQHPAYYDLSALNAQEALWRSLQHSARQLDDVQAQIWRRDTVLLQLTQPVRDQIRQRLSAP